MPKRIKNSFFFFCTYDLFAYFIHSNLYDICMLLNLFCAHADYSCLLERLFSNHEYIQNTKQVLYLYTLLLCFLMDGENVALRLHQPSSAELKKKKVFPESVTMSLNMSSKIRTTLECLRERTRCTFLKILMLSTKFYFFHLFYRQ